MTLSVRHKSNIRHFVYYLVNGTLDFVLIRETFGGTYYEKLKSRPDLFYKTACVFINQEIKLDQEWLDTKKLGKFICQLYKNNINTVDFEDWETNFNTQKSDYSSDFKNFTNWFIKSNTLPGVTYNDYIGDGASFVEQCFAIWSNVIELEQSRVTNNDYAIERVEQYIRSYYIPGYIDNLEEWECELHIE
jgi:hypothetical protein